MNTELEFFWLAAVLYGASAFLYVLSFILKKEGFMRQGMLLAGLGFLPHTLCVMWRWIEPGYIPVLSTYEIVSNTSWAGILVFLLARSFAQPVRHGGILIMPLTLFLMVWAGVSGKEIGTSPPSFHSWWLLVHVISAGFSYGAFLVAAAMALPYLLKEKILKKGVASPFYDKLSELEVFDNLNYRFVAVGFIMLTVMIIAGALWANKVHGRYWSWDPLEVQSLICWLIFAVWLHVRLTLGWRGKKLAWYSLLALPVIVMSFCGVPFIPGTFHSGFRIEH